MLPDAARSYAVLIGSSRFDNLTDLPAVENNLRALYEILTAESGTGLPAENCQVLSDPVSSAEVGAALEDARAKADDLFLVYYSGHGLLDDPGDLWLSLPGTSQRLLAWTGVPIRTLRETLARSSARNRILILDCCFAGRAIAAMAADASLVAAQVEAAGACTITSSPANMPSRAPVGEAFTSFTGALVELLRDGVPHGPELITIDVLFRQLVRHHAANGLPPPQQIGANTVHQLALTRNSWRSAHPPAVRQPALHVEVFQHPLVPFGTRQINGLVAVSSSSGGSDLPVVPMAEVLVIHGTTDPESLAAVTRAVADAVDTLPETSSFAVVAGTARDQLVYPTAERGLIRAGRQAKAEARIALAGLRTTGEATMSACLALAGRILADGDGGDADMGIVRHATLVVVGPDEAPDPGRDLVFDEFAGMFVCDGRGFGCNWSVKDLRAITAAFEGTCDICTDPAGLTDGLRRIHDDYASKNWPAAELAVLCQPGVRVAFIKQVEPQVKQLRVKTGTTYSIGPWSVGQEADFWLALDIDHPAGPEEVIVAGITVSATAAEETRARSFVTVAGGDVQLPHAALRTVGVGPLSVQSFAGAETFDQSGDVAQAVVGEPAQPGGDPFDAGVSQAAQQQQFGSDRL